MNAIDALRAVRRVYADYGYSTHAEVYKDGWGAATWVGSAPSGVEARVLHGSVDTAVEVYVEGDYAGVYCDDESLEVLRAALEDELIDRYDVCEKQELRKMRRDHV